MSDVRSILSPRVAILVLGFATALLPSGPASAAEPTDLENKLTITVGGVDKTLTLEEAMDALNIPSVSLALIDRDRVAFARAYGAGATPETLYQAASLSKFVAAVGAMRLVDGKRLDLDEDVNARLTTWKVPTNGFDKGHPVTLRGLLSMTAGIGVPGFLGYEVGAPLPNLTQILYGAPPANSPQITVIAEPGSAYHYSGVLRNRRSLDGRCQQNPLPGAYGDAGAETCRHGAQHLRAAFVARPRGGSADGPRRRRQGIAWRVARFPRACGGGSVVDANRPRQPPSCRRPRLARREPALSSAGDRAGDA
jgi:hypothetical protein